MCDALNKLGSDSNKINPLVSPGSLLQAPLDDDASRGTVTKHLCDTQRCPIDLITPPDDCHVNYTLSFSLQICRVEDLVNGIMKGSIVHIHRVRTVIVGTDGVLTTLELGNRKVLQAFLWLLSSLPNFLLQNNDSVVLGF
ncbi:uncharacterized protein LOC107609857 [Arachis ipaensis]|uniref:uncharacterized protein LOC107609857 n=1 Tax=Arachis ipaensis TaxID=130454 RepID=UPI000A2B7997|nr:uncharacterized protein LOC107609857 [Arachis ipaensis]XP_020963273.1 uncharacterized protein LOC107609857 [Arachis ipaensis]